MSESAQVPPQQEQLLARVLELFRAEVPPQSEQLSFINEATPEQLANLIESVADNYRTLLWQALRTELWWPVLHLLQYDTAKHLLSRFSHQQRRALLPLMQEVDLLNFAEILPAQLVDEYLDQQEPAQTQSLQAALAYQDEEVGRYLESRILKVRSNSSVHRVWERIEQSTEQVKAVFVVNRAGVVEGHCDWRALALADVETRVGEIAQPVSVLNPEQKMLEAAQSVLLQADLNWLPVVQEQKLIGAISMDLLSQRLKEKSLEGLVTESGSDEEDLFSPIKVAARIRAFWLLTNLLTAFMASAVIGMFEKTLQQVVELAILMPVVASMGGIAGSQTLAVALRGLALNHLHQSNIRMLIDKELKIAAINGIALGLVIAMVVWQWFDSAGLGLIIFVAIVCNALAAASSGTYIPFVLKRIKVDPAVAGAVILTTVTDIVGFIVFLGLGSLLWSMGG